MKEKNGKPLLGFEQFFIDINGIESIKKQALVLDEVKLTKPKIFLTKLKNGNLNLAELSKSKLNLKKRKKRRKTPHFLFTRTSRHQRRQIGVGRQAF